MKHATRKTAKRQTASYHFKQRLREGGLIMLIAGALFLLLVLITYHSSDPSWSATGQSTTIANAGGKAGAWIADVLLYLFGYMAYFFPLMIIFGAWLGFSRHLQSEDDERFRRLFLFMKGSGFLLMLMAGSGLANLALSASPSHLPFSAGGILGTVVGHGMLHLFNEAGAAMILATLLLVGSTLFSGFSWLSILEKIGAYVWDMIARLKQRWEERKAAKSQNEEESEEEEEYEEDEDEDDEEDEDDDEEDDEDSEDEEEEERPRKARARKRIEPRLTPEINRPIVNAPKKIEPSIRAEKERQAILFEMNQDVALPPLTLLDNNDKSKGMNYSTQQLENMSRDVELRLRDFGVEAKVVAVHPGPVVTRFELQLAAGTKVSRVSNLAKDLARSLSVVSVRVVEVIPGKSVIGLELPNEHRETVQLREIIASQQYDNARSPATLALGKDIAGHPVIVDLAKMPHLLVAGTTGSGKSVCLNAMLLSLLYKSTPKDLRLILIDPKMLELSIYQDIPHLLVPVVTDMKEAANALRWCVVEMDRRYRLMASLGVRNITGYNSKIREAVKKGAPLLDPLVKDEPQELQELPYIVILADEFADMMMVVGKKVEELIARIAQKARAAGIHLILATQRPSVDVITGLIKANIPTRIAFQVSSKIDSRTILDQAGAEQLLGHGDMLYLAPGTGVPVRVHGAFVSDEEVHRVVADLKKRGKPEYIEEILEDTTGSEGGTGENGEGDAEQDPLYDQAVKIVLETRRASISSIQRRLKIGYNRAARIVEAMEKAGLVSAMDSSGSREVLVSGHATVD